MVEIEYKALRDLILKRIDTRDRVMQINATILAGILALSTVRDFSPNLILIYPPISTMLAVIWARNEYNLQLTYLYIRTRLEPTMPGARWEAWRWQQRFRPTKTTSIWHLSFMLKSEFSLFLILQIITIIIGVSIIQGDKLTYMDQILISLDLSSILIITWIAITIQKKLIEVIADEESLPPDTE